MTKLSNNPLENWVNNEPELLQLLEDTEMQAETENEKAKIAFNKLAEKYCLPMFPEDLDSSEKKQTKKFHTLYKNSLYEILGQVKFADNNPQNIKSNVLMAAYLVKNKREPFIEDALKKYLKKDALLGLGYKGEGIDVELIPIKKGESWLDKGCIYFTKIV